MPRSLIEINYFAKFYQWVCWY